MLSNFNTLVMLRVVEEQTARYLTDKLEQVPVPSLVPVSAATDTNDPTALRRVRLAQRGSLTFEEQPLLTPADVGKLPRGQAFVWMDGGALVKLRMPLPTPEPGEALPASIEQLAQAMAARYEQAYGEDEESRPALTVAGKGHGF